MPRSGIGRASRARNVAANKPAAIESVFGSGDKRSKSKQRPARAIIKRPRRKKFPVLVPAVTNSSRQSVVRR
jgi:hypothetical protein